MEEFKIFKSALWQWIFFFFFFSFLNFCLFDSIAGISLGTVLRWGRWNEDRLKPISIGVCVCVVCV